MRTLVSTLVTFFLVALSGASIAQTPAGRWVEGKLAVADKDDGREYRLYVPAAAAPGDKQKALPLVVMLHGCTQSPQVFAESTRMNAHADRERFLVLYPAQGLTANPARCWNWYMPENQARGSGEPAEIVALIEQVARDHAVDRKRVYVAGLSAGASMTAILAACYPDVFAAAAIHDGTMYRSASSVIEAAKVMASAEAPDPDALAEQAWACGGKRRLAMPVMVWHGLGDNVVNRENGALLVRQFARLNDWADDGQANGSTPKPPSTRAGQVPGGHAYTLASYAHQGRPLIEYYQVERMGHAWSGGKDDLLFSDAKGPDASGLMWAFFRQFSR